MLGTVTIIIAYMVIAGYQFKGGGRFIAILSEGSITPETGMIIAAFLIVGFTVLAGMVSIVSIDIFNGCIMLLAMIVTAAVRYFRARRTGCRHHDDSANRAKPPVNHGRP